MQEFASPSDNSEPAARRAYHALERLIVTLELAPGSVATEGRLIELVGLGRTPVREAVQRLQWEGLVEVRPRAGLAIAPLDPRDWLRVLEVREGVERVLTRRAATYLDDGTRMMLGDAAAAMQEAAAIGDVDMFLKADKAVDEAISAAADNSFASRLAAPLQTHSRRFWFRYCRADGPGDSARQHLAVIRHIVFGDADRAEAETAALMALLREQARSAAAV